VKRRIFWISLCVMSIILLFFAFAASNLFYEERIESKRTELKHYVDIFSLSEYTWDDEGARLYSERLEAARVTFLDGKGNVIGDSKLKELSNHALRNEVQAAIQNGEGYVVRYSESSEAEMLYYCKVLERDGVGAPTKLIRISVKVISVWRAFADSIPAYFAFLAAGLILCIFFSYIATDYLIGPVRQLAKDAASSKEVSPKYPELKPIGEILNRRNEEVQAQFLELAKEKESAEKAQESKNEFISNITHEMNTPLTSIHGYSELLATGELDAEEVKNAAAVIVKQSERLSGLIAQIINYNRLDDRELSDVEVDLSSTVHEVLETLSPDIQKRKIRVTKEICADVKVTSRYERLHELVGNLVRNAIRYNKDSGEIFVRLDRTEHDVPRLVVRDTGRGIAEENLERVFDRFFTVDKSHGGRDGGYGLGLAVVKKICRNYGWIIHLQSTLGEGSTFTVLFGERRK